MATVDELVRLAEHPKFVGIGESGLDYHYSAESKANPAGKPANSYRRRARNRPAADHSCPRRRRGHDGTHPVPRLHAHCAYDCVHALLFLRCGAGASRARHRFLPFDVGHCRLPQRAARCARFSPPHRAPESLLKPMRPILRRHPIAVSATSPDTPCSHRPQGGAQALGMDWPDFAAQTQKKLRASVPEGRPRPGGGLMAQLPIRHPGLRLVGRRAARRRALGRMRPRRASQRPAPLCSILIEQEGAEGITRVLIDTHPRSARATSRCRRSESLTPCSTLIQPCRPCARAR